MATNYNLKEIITLLKEQGIKVLPRELNFNNKYYYYTHGIDGFELVDSYHSFSNKKIKDTRFRIVEISGKIDSFEYYDGKEDSLYSSTNNFNAFLSKILNEKT